MIYFANTLRQLRKDHDMTQSEVASCIGLDRSTYAYYERGATKPDFECILRICKMYGMDLNDITNMFLEDSRTSITFKTLDEHLNDDEQDSFLHKLNMLNIDEYEKMILYFYHQTPEELKKLFFVKIKQCFDEVTGIK